MVSKRRAGFAWQLLILRIFFLGLSTTMEQRVAQAVRCMGEDDFDLFGPSDRAALMELVTDYFCGDEQDFEELSSGMRARLLHPRLN